MKRILRKQMRQDEFVTGFGRALQWSKAHAREVRIGVAVVLGLSLAGLGITAFQRHRQGQAQAALEGALQTFHAPVAGESNASEAGVSSFSSAKEKYQKAVSAFDEVARRWGSIEEGRRARYYAALCRLEMGDDAAAESALVPLAARREKDRLEPVLARLALAESHRRRGEWDKAIDLLRQLADDQASEVPRDYALLSLAQTLEEAGRIGDARASYRRLADEFPTSVYVTEARRRAEYLQSGA